MPDTDLDFLRTLDPTLHDAPPAPGSARYDAIRAKARRTRSRRWTTWAAAATGVAASVLATVVVLGGGSPSPAAAVRTAAEQTGDVVTLRGTAEDVIKTGGASSSTVEVNGQDSKYVTRDGNGVVTLTIVDGIGYETGTDGTSRRSTMSPEWDRAPFAEATGNVVRAALTGSDVTDRGTERVRGIETTHYRVEMTAASRAALRALPVTQTAQLGVQQVGDAPEHELTSLDIWTADGLIRRIVVDVPERTTTYEYYDFNRPVTITVPPGF